MNDIAKEATADRFLKALQKEGMTKSQAGENIGLTAAQVSYLFNTKYWDRLGNGYWDKVLAWANSGYSLKDYPKHRRPIELKVTEISDKPINVEFPEITDPEFEEEVVPSVVNLLDNHAIHIFIKKNSNMIIAKDRNYYFMPFWFSFIDDGKIEFFSLGSLPEDLKDAIKLMRGE